MNDYGLKVAEEHQDTLADLLDYAGKVKEFEVQQKEIEAFLSTIQFELIGVNGAWKTYSAVVENTTSIDFTYLTLCASLLNADGTIDDVAQDSVSNFKRGDVATFAFSTDKEFSAIEMQANEPTDHGIFKGAYVDQAFIKSLASGLEVRWERWDEEIKKGIDLTVTSDSYINTNIACIQAELDEILKYQDETFSDHVLKEKMCSYIDCLYGLEEALQYPKVDLQKYYNLWYNAYYERSKLIESFVNNYGLEVTETYQEELDDQVECGRLMREFAYQQNEEEIKGFLSSIQFALTNINGEWKTYTAVVENTTDVDFRFIDIDITLLDADDTVMGTSYDGVSNVRSGDVVTFAFSTNQEFLKLETQVSGSVG